MIVRRVEVTRISLLRPHGHLCWYHLAVSGAPGFTWEVSRTGAHQGLIVHGPRDHFWEILARRSR